MHLGAPMLQPLIGYDQGRILFFVTDGDDTLFLPKERLAIVLRRIDDAIDYSPDLRRPETVYMEPFDCPTHIFTPVGFTIFTLAGQSARLEVDRPWLRMMKPVFKDAENRISLAPKRNFKIGPGPDGMVREYPPDFRTVPPSAT